MEFRNLKANEIELRVGTINAKGFSLLLYKNARIDMQLLDEVVGAMNWKREHTRDNKNCIVSIFDNEKKEWVSKEDTGTESYTEKEKGLASDSFKRACVNWGIGRSLYTAPFIWINDSTVIQEFKGKYKLKNGTHYTVKNIDYDKNNIINFLEIEDNKKIVKYSFDNREIDREKIIEKMKSQGKEYVDKICVYYSVVELDELENSILIKFKEKLKNK